MGENPEEDCQPNSNPHDEQTLKIHKDTPNPQTAIDEARKGIFIPDKPKIAKYFQDGQPYPESGDDFGDHQPPYAQKDKTVQEGTYQCGKKDGQGNSKEIR